MIIGDGPEYFRNPRHAVIKGIPLLRFARNGSTGKASLNKKGCGDRTERFKSPLWAFFHGLEDIPIIL